MNIAVIVPYLPEDSTKALLERCKESIDDRFYTFYQADEHHEGVSVMRNKGLDLIYAYGLDVDYITFLDADDTLGEDAYEQIVAAINEQPNEGIIQLNHGEDELFVLECLAKTRQMYVSSRIALHYHKDNPNSLSTTTSLNDLIGEQTALMWFAMMHKEDAEMLAVIRRRQAELWSNACYTRVFGA